MRFPKFRFVIFAAVILGVLVPVGFSIASRFGYFFGSTLDLCVWPTSIILMATETHGYDWFAVVTLAVSVATNVLYYFIILTFIWCVGWVLRAWVHRFVMVKRSNQALERTAASCASTSQMVKTVSLEAERGLGGSRSACSS